MPKKHLSTSLSDCDEEDSELSLNENESLGSEEEESSLENDDLSHGEDEVSQ